MKYLLLCDVFQILAYRCARFLKISNNVHNMVFMWIFTSLFYLGELQRA